MATPMIQYTLMLESGRATVQGMAGEMERELQNLRGWIEELQATWRGAAHLNFAELHGEWHVAENNLVSIENGVLGDISTALEQVWQNASNTEATNASNFRGGVHGHGHGHGHG